MSLTARIFELVGPPVSAVAPSTVSALTVSALPGALSVGLLLPGRSRTERDFRFRQRLVKAFWCRPYKMTPVKVRLALAPMGRPGTNVAELCAELGVTYQALYRHVSSTGELREDGRKVLGKSRSK